MFSFFFFNDTATTEIYTLSLHDALPICQPRPTTRNYEISMELETGGKRAARIQSARSQVRLSEAGLEGRSEEHTSELQSPDHLVCRLLLEKKKKLRS